MRKVNRIGRVLLLVLALVMGSCTQISGLASSEERELPQLDGSGPFLRFQSFLLTAPDCYQALEEYSNAHRAGVFSESEGAKLVEKLKSRRGFELVSTPT